MKNSYFSKIILMQFLKSLTYDMYHSPLYDIGKVLKAMIIKCVLHKRKSTFYSGMTLVTLSNSLIKRPVCMD